MLAAPTKETRKDVDTAPVEQGEGASSSRTIHSEEPLKRIETETAGAHDVTVGLLLTMFLLAGYQSYSRREKERPE